MIEKITDMKQITALFDGWEESCIKSCLQCVMGEVFANKDRTSAVAVVGCFGFYAGEPDEELVRYLPELQEEFIVKVPQNASWEPIIEQVHKEKAKKVTRYAIKKEPGVFDKEMLEEVVAKLPSDYTLKMIDSELFDVCLKEEWSKYFVCNYDSFEEFEQKNAMGVMVMVNDEPVAGVSSYSSYHEGIEIEVDTSEPYRRKGLAFACSAKLILECLKRNLYPNWDAQNKWSVALAEKLGYHFSHEYTAYEIVIK